jgi:hypothetical protein
MTGEQLKANIYIGPTYYMRLKHMVKDKINYRARGPNTFLTRQAVQGRANDGGLRIGEMERDGVLAHGMSYFLNESFLIRGDEYFMAVCNKTGAIAIYNEARNLFLSPYADGPIKFHTNPDGSMNIKNISKFSRSFSVLRIPYTFKLLIHELQCMNIQMRIITDLNVDQLLGMSYSNNINKLLQSDKPHKELVSEYVANMKFKLNSGNKYKGLPNEEPILPDEDENGEEGEKELGPLSPDYDPLSPDYVPLSPDYAPLTPDLIREEQPDGTVRVRPRFSQLLNPIFNNMSKENQLSFIKKPESEQINELKRLYKIEFLNRPKEEKEGILRKLTYNNSQYDVNNIAEYLTKNNEMGKKGIEDLLKTTNLIKINREKEPLPEDILKIEEKEKDKEGEKEEGKEGTKEERERESEGSNSNESKNVSFEDKSGDNSENNSSSNIKKINL